MRNYEKIEFFLREFESGKLRYEDGQLFRKGNFIKGTKKGKGKYLHIGTTKNYKHVYCSVHCLIFAYHHGIDELKKHETIDHINGDKYDNRIENLQGLTRFENSQKDSGGVLSIDDAKEIKRLLAEGLTSVEIAKRYSVSSTTISKIKRGLRFKYI